MRPPQPRRDHRITLLTHLSRAPRPRTVVVIAGTPSPTTSSRARANSRAKSAPTRRPVASCPAMKKCASVLSLSVHRTRVALAPLSRASIAHLDVYVRGDVSSRSRAVSRVREDRAHDSDGDYEGPRARAAAATRRRVSARAMSTLARGDALPRSFSVRTTRRATTTTHRAPATPRANARGQKCTQSSTRDDDDDAMREGDAERGREKGRQVHSPSAPVGKVAGRDDADDADDVAAANPPPPRKARGVGAGGGWPQLRAAVESGADCVYLGLDARSTRARGRAISRSMSYRA